MKKIFQKISKIKKKIEENLAIKIIYNILKTIITIVLLMILFVIIIQKVTRNNFNIGKYKIFTVVSGSMQPEYQIGDMILSENVDPSTIKVGDNVVYLGQEDNLAGLIITHKVINIRNDDNGEIIFTTKGTANRVEDPEINSNQIYGKVIYKSVVLSYLSKVMMNVYAYYFLTTIMGVVISIQIIKAIYDVKNEDEEEIEE